ncbi:unnamed protein product, partial [Didymodactylos carnosus]
KETANHHSHYDLNDLTLKNECVLCGKKRNEVALKCSGKNCVHFVHATRSELNHLSLRIDIWDDYWGRTK